MAKKKTAGRKKIVIDWVKVDKVLEAGANGVQVAAMLGIHFDTLSTRCKEDHNSDFSDYSRQKKEKGNVKLLTAQFDVAIEGDKAMLIWLGKQRLDQTDKKDIDHTSGGEKIKSIDPITWANGKD